MQAVFDCVWNDRHYFNYKVTNEKRPFPLKTPSFHLDFHPKSIFDFD
jgi:hypothetical protein